MKKVWLFVFLTGLMSVFSGLVYAEETKQYEPEDVAVSTPVASGAPAGKELYELEDVVITGTKTQLKVKDSPAAVSVVTKTEIEAKNLTYIDDSLTSLPGVSVSRTGKGEQFNVDVAMRGITGGGRNLILLDGYPLNNQNNGLVFWNRVPVELVERVEVVRGPFSSLYGKRAMGGVINIITKSPAGKRLTYKQGYDSTGIRTTSISYGDNIGEKFAFYAGYENQIINGYTYYNYVTKQAVPGTSATKVDGFIKTLDPTGKTQYIIGEYPKNEKENNDITGKLYFFPSVGHSLSLLVSYQYWDQLPGVSGKSYLRDTNGATITNGTVELSGTGNRITVSEKDFFVGPHKNQFLLSNLQYKGKIKENLDLTVNLGYIPLGPEPNTVSRIANDATTLKGKGFDGVFRDAGARRINLQADWKLAKHLLIFGSDYDDSFSNTFTSNYDFWGDVSTRGSYSKKVEGKDKTAAFFIQDEWKILSNLTTYAGLRYDYWSTSGRVENISPINNVLAYDERSKEVVSPKISLVYKPVEQGALRFSAGSAFNPPLIDSLYVYYYSPTNETIPNPDLKPEINNAWEIGGEYDFPTKTKLSATYFANYVDNLIYSSKDPDNTLITKSWNAGKSVIKGIETEVNQQIFSYLNAFVNYTYVDGRITENAFLPKTVGKKLTGVPEHTGNIGLKFSSQGFNAVLSGNYSSKRYRNDENNDIVDGVLGSYDPYTVVDFKSSYAFNWGKVSFGVNNIFDLQYYTNYKTAGRTVNVELGFKI